jgi:hypothetical protein
MTQDEIIKMAYEAGIIQPQNVIKTLEIFANLVAQHEHQRFYDAAMKAAEKAVDVAMSLEREACAKVCESMNKYMDDGEECATAIRARGQA